MSYAKGKNARGMCQRCGFVMKLSELREDGQTPGLLVCCDCYDIEHPAETPVRVSEGIALRRPAPDLDKAASTLPVGDTIATTEGWTPGENGTFGGNT